MHLLRAQPGDIDDGAEAVDLGQDPAEIVFAGHADTELALLARCHARIEDPPGLRLANLARLTHHLSVDTYVARTVAGAGLVVLRLLGGVASWAYGVERVVLTCRRHGIPLVLLTGSDEDDPALAERSTVGDERRAALWAYLAQGGAENGRRFLLAARALLRDDAWPEPAEPVARAGLYRRAEPGGGPLLVVVFYRALLMAEDLAPVDALIREAAACGLRVTAVFVQSLKDPVARAFLDDLLTEEPPDVVVNLTGFAVSQPGAVHEPGPLDRIGAVVLQAVAAGTTRERWRASAQGLSARDLAMSVVLPEVDGRVFTRAIAFKSARARIEATQSDLVALEPLSDRVRFVVAQAAAWARLRRSPAGARRVALLLANYPNQDARLANGVGLDTPESAAVVMRALEEAGYVVSGCPESGRALMDMLRAGPTNARRRTSDVRLDRAAYARFSDALPEELRSAVVARWGAVEKDPAFRDGAFHLALHRMGNVVVGIQPARGYEVDPKATYHDPALVPPHGYIAFYAWLRTQFDAHAIVHLGKHGNLEWLPGKALGLSAACWPEAVLGPLPHLYPFIVNDPGEGSQAKRRTSAVVVDHLTPPLTRAESYGPLRDLEALVDEYYDAAGQDPRRLDLLRGQIHEMMALHSLDEDAGIEEGEEEDAALVKLDAWLCDLKERQIRDGLHVFGRSPEGRQETDLLVAVARGQRPSLIRTLADDLALGGFDPLACDMAQPWTGPRPEVLAALSDDLWRSVGDTVERLELLAVAVVEGRVLPPGPASAARLAAMEETLCRSLRACGPAEIESLLTGLDGRFVAPGPSGAPTRDRADVLPTGRNFYAVDTRSVPTPAAWTLGWRSAVRLLDRYRQEHGSWPERIGLSAWGTANMRTGGDDIAQALALIGVKPVWEHGSRRVTG
ncbi:MAG: cobaltochelatase subunit CobN, partial [Geminicoccaceae bacterium]|nr:cobaltochelatase subunit CobN [Geminicoccaceae bacterium]